MKKVILIAVLVLIDCFIFADAVNAQSVGRKKDSALMEKGYVGSVGGTLSSGASAPIGISVTTSHGYSFGNGLWMGGGLSVECLWDQNPSIPIFAEAKYAYDCGKIDPFVSCRIGLCVWQLGAQVLGYVSPSFGIDYGRWSFFISYENMDLLKFAGLGFSWSFR